MKLTKAQQVALKRVYDRNPMKVSYLKFRRSTFQGFCAGVAHVEWAGMLLGIEVDGSVHS